MLLYFRGITWYLFGLTYQWCSLEIVLYVHFIKNTSVTTSSVFLISCSSSPNHSNGNSPLLPRPLIHWPPANYSQKLTKKFCSGCLYNFIPPVIPVFIHPWHKLYVTKNIQTTYVQIVVQRWGSNNLKIIQTQNGHEICPCLEVFKKKTQKAILETEAKVFWDPPLGIITLGQLCGSWPCLFTLFIVQGQVNYSFKSETSEIAVCVLNKTIKLLI